MTVAANSAINFRFVNIEELLVRGPPILPVGPADSNGEASVQARRYSLGAVRRIALLSLVVVALVVLAGCGAASDQTPEQRRG